MAHHVPRHIFLVLVALCVGAGTIHAQDRKPTAQETAAIRACAKKYQDDVGEGERHCVFNLVATPCTKRGVGRSNQGEAACYALEQAIWDDLLNDTFKALRDDLGDDQKAKLRDMQRTWIAYRDSTCSFYYDKIQGTMAIPMTASCLTRETARRAMLLTFFSKL
jgi:uncharacterized protein YecT (DUF1311 family)